MLLLALLGAATVAFLTYGFRKKDVHVRLNFRLGFFIFSAFELLFTFAAIQRGDSFLNIVDPSVSTVEGWLLKACNESAFHVVVLISLCLVFASVKEMQQRRPSNGSKAGALH